MSQPKPLRHALTADYTSVMSACGFEPYSDVWPQHVHESVAECIDNTAEGSAGDLMIDRLRVTPTAPGYLPLFIPKNRDWLHDVRQLVSVSTQAFIAELYARLFELKRDHKEKGLYIFWNHDVPLPTPATALFWLLTCEAWPMPNHRLLEVDGRQVDGLQVDVPELTRIFPFQSVHLPQGTPLGSGGVIPSGFSQGRHAGAAAHLQSLNQGFITSLTREDRAMMEECLPAPLVGRPRRVHYTHMDAHKGNGNRVQWWSDSFPWSPMASIDSGYANYEWMESHFHHQQLSKLRLDVMDNLITAPGIPGSNGYANSFYDAPGLWIRNWSEQGVIVRNTTESAMRWTAKNESVALADGRPFHTVPNMSPRFWFGFTIPEIGEKYIKGDDGQPKRVESATERWLEAYCEVREVGLRMLFAPDLVDMPAILDSHVERLEARMRKAGRIKTSTTKSRIDDAFSAFLGQAPKPKE